MKTKKTLTQRTNTFKRFFFNQTSNSTGRIIRRGIRYLIINLIDDMENIPENVIHVTGFGVFRGFTSTNPSWEAVNQLPDHITHNGETIPIVKHQVPVTYDAVDKKISEIWLKKPKVSLICFFNFS